MIHCFSVLFLLILTSLPAFSQLYYAKKGGTSYYVDVKSDGAHVEVFTIQGHYYYVCKPDDDFLKPVKNDNDTVFTGKDNHLLKIRNSYRLVHRPSRSRKFKTIKLEPCVEDERDVLRNKACVFDFKLKVQKLESISMYSNQPPQRILLPNEGESYLDDLDINMPNSLFKKQFNKFGDSLIAQLLQRDTLLSYFYYSKDSIGVLDSATIFRMLSKGKYPYVNSYSNDFLYYLSNEKPEYLIYYLDGNPSNKTEILNAIRDHNQYKEIVENVKKSNTNSVAKKEVVKQKGKRIRGDIIAATIVSTVIVAEITGLILLGIWIF